MPAASRRSSSPTASARPARRARATAVSRMPRRAARVAVGGLGDRAGGGLGQPRRPTPPRPRSRVGGGLAEQPLEVRALEAPQREDAAAREQRRHDLEGGVLGGGADQRHRAVLDVGQQGVLLGAVEAVELVDEEHRAPAAPAPPCAARSIASRTSFTPASTAESGDELRVRAFAEQPRERRLAAARRPPEDQRGEVALLDQGAQRGAGRDEGVLAAHLVEGAGPHALGERRAEPGAGARRGAALGNSSGVSSSGMARVYGASQRAAPRCDSHSGGRRRGDLVMGGAGQADPIRSVGLCLKPDSSAAAEVARRIDKWLAERGVARDPRRRGRALAAPRRLRAQLRRGARRSAGCAGRRRHACSRWRARPARVPCRSSASTSARSASSRRWRRTSCRAPSRRCSPASTAWCGACASRCAPCGTASPSSRRWR